MVGAPNFYYTDVEDTDAYFDLIQEADDAGLLMAIDTAGTGDDSLTNLCGLT